MPAPSPPFFAEECQFARAFKVFNGYKSAGFSGFGELRFDTCNDAADKQFVFLGKGGFIIELGATGVAHGVEDDFKIVERMCREIDSDKVALTVQSLNGAPFVCLWYGGCGYFNGFGGTEERVLGLCLLGLIELPVSDERVEESRAFTVGRGIAFSSYSKVVKAAA